MRPALVLIATAAVLTGCATTPPTAPVSSTAGPTTSTPATTGVTVSPPTVTTDANGLTPQGFLAMNIAEPSGLDCDAGASGLDTCRIRFTVDQVATDPTCQPNGVPPTAGRKTVVLTVTMTTGTLTPDGAKLVDMIWNPFSLKGLTADGAAFDVEPGRCLSETGRFPSTVLANTKTTGTVEIDVPSTVTSVASVSPVRTEGVRGWVWPVG